jgi:hypothetical protein
VKQRISAHERALLRQHGLAPAGLAALHAPTLSALTGIDLERCRYLIAMAAFQSLTSIGPAAAQDLWDVGCRDLTDVARADPLAMLATLTLQAGPQDPCVEDVLRCAVAQARDPSLPAERKQWWYWKHQRGLALDDVRTDL